MQAKILNPKITAGYRLNLASAGYIAQVEDDGVKRFGWTVTDADLTATRRYPWQGRNLVAMTDTCLFIGSDLAETLGVNIDWGTAELHLGRKTLWAVSFKDLGHGLERQDYAPRSEREAEVRRRNIEVIHWLANLGAAIFGTLPRPAEFSELAKTCERETVVLLAA